jgi:hypothetical protein
LKGCQLFGTDDFSIQIESDSGQKQDEDQHEDGAAQNTSSGDEQTLPPSRQNGEEANFTSHPKPKGKLKTPPTAAENGTRF